MKTFKKLLKEVCKIMSNKTSEIIDTSKRAFVEISNDENSTRMLSNLFIGLGVGLGVGFVVTGVLIRCK